MQPFLGIKPGKGYFSNMSIEGKLHNPYLSILRAYQINLPLNKKLK